MSILNSIKQFIEQNQIVSEKNIAEQFNISQGSIESMLMIFINKGFISKQVIDNQTTYCLTNSNPNLANKQNTFTLTMNLKSKNDCNSGGCGACKFGCEK